MAILNRELALELAGGDAELLAELVGLYISDRDVVLTRIRDGVRDWDAHAVERSSHRLKGSLATLAADDAKHAAGVLETIGREDRAEEAAAALAALESALELLEPVLQDVASQT